MRGQADQESSYCPPLITDDICPSIFVPSFDVVDTELLISLALSSTITCLVSQYTLLEMATGGEHGVHGLEALRITQCKKAPTATFLALPSEIRQQIFETFVDSTLLTAGDDQVAVDIDNLTIAIISLKSISCHHDLERSLRNAAAYHNRLADEFRRYMREWNQAMYKMNETALADVVDEFKSRHQQDIIGVLSQYVRCFATEAFSHDETSAVLSSIESFSMEVNGWQRRIEVWFVRSVNGEAALLDQVRAFWKKVIASVPPYHALPMELEQQIPRKPKHDRSIYVGTWERDGRIKSIVYSMDFGILMSAPGEKHEASSARLSWSFGLLENDRR